MSKRERDNQDAQEKKKFRDGVLEALKEMAEESQRPYDYEQVLKQLVSAVEYIDCRNCTKELEAISTSINSVADALDDIGSTLKKICTLMEEKDED